MKAPVLVAVFEIYDGIAPYSLNRFNSFYRSLQSGRIRQAVDSLNQYVFVGATGW